MWECLACENISSAHAISFSSKEYERTSKIEISNSFLGSDGSAFAQVMSLK